LDRELVAMVVVAVAVRADTVETALNAVADPLAIFTTQIGALMNGLAKVTVKDVVLELLFTTPAVSLPATVHAPPHPETVGTGPPVTMCPPEAKANVPEVAEVEVTYVM
jgi:hypothetical protein